VQLTLRREVKTQTANNTKRHPRSPPMSYRSLNSTTAHRRSHLEFVIRRTGIQTPPSSSPPHRRSLVSSNAHLAFERLISFREENIATFDTESFRDYLTVDNFSAED